jgi:hypothetical protein
MLPTGASCNLSERNPIPPLTRSNQLTSHTAAPSPTRRTSLSRSTSCKSSALSTAASAAVHASLLRQFESAVGRFVARLDRAWSAIAAARDDLSTVVGEFSAIEARVDGVQATLRGELADGMEELEAERAVDTYLERVIDKLIYYGRSIRLVAYYIDPETGKHYRPEQCKHLQQQQLHHDRKSTLVTTVPCPFEQMRRQGMSACIYRLTSLLL